MSIDGAVSKMKFPEVGRKETYFKLDLFQSWIYEHTYMKGFAKNNDCVSLIICRFWINKMAMNNNIVLPAAQYSAQY